MPSFIGFFTKPKVVELIFIIVTSLISFGPLDRMMSKNHKIVVLVVILLLTAGGSFAVIWSSTHDLELNLVNAATSSSGVTVRYEINNHSSGSWTCDPSKFRVEFSDGTSYPAVAESSKLSHNRGRRFRQRTTFF